MKRTTVFALLLIVCISTFAVAQDYRGVAVSTNYPSITTSSRDLIIMNLKVTNYGVAPQRVDLSLVQTQPGWETAFIGGGGMVSAVFASPDSPASTQLWLDPPDTAAAGTYRFVVRGQGPFGHHDLPITITIGDQLPRRLNLKPELPVLSGSPSADFTFHAKLSNHSAQEGLINLHAETPDGFQVTFKKKYAKQELTSLPMDAGADVDLEIAVKPPHDVAAGKYPVKIVAEEGKARAEADLTVSVKGQPELSLDGPDGRLSDTAVAGKARAINLTIKNSGAEAATNITFNGAAPRNWKVTFSPEKVDSIPAGKSVDVVASIVPSSEAITGDYNVTLRAGGDNVQASNKFRITVRTSALWGIVAVLIIALALMVVMLAIRRYGRR